MSVSIEVRPIAAEDTIAIRWAILRPGFARDTAIFAGDDVPGTQHFGVFMDDRLVGVASLYDAPLPDETASLLPRQLRGMATLPEVRGSGCGRALLETCHETALRAGSTLLWCNARHTAVDFYRRYGWELCSEEFDIPIVGPHFRMRRALAQLRRENRGAAV
jgi:predicted GNAT family N-acyltransferase